MNKGAALEVLLKLRDEFSSELGRAHRAIDSFQGKASTGLTKVRDVAKVAAFAVGGIAVAAGAMAMSGIDAASDLNESMSKVGVVFGENADDIKDWSKESAQNLGLAQQQALEFAGTFGNLFEALEMGPEATKDMSKGVVELATDLASFNNLNTTDVLEKLRAGLVGEAEPLRALGVNINAATVEAKAMEMGLADANGELSEAAKVQARYALILEQTTNAQGDFARTAGGLANQKRILSAEVKNLQASLGMILLPVVTLLVSFLAREAVPVLQDVVGWISTFSDVVSSSLNGDVMAAAAAFAALPPPLQQVALWLAENKDEIENVIVVARELAMDVLSGWVRIFQELGPLLADFGRYLAEHKPLAIALAIALGALVAVLIGIPALIFGIIVVAGLLAAHWDELRAKTVELWNGIPGPIQAALELIWSLVVIYFQLIRNQIETAIKVIRDIVIIVMALIRGDWAAAWEGLKQLVSDVWNGMLTDIGLKLQALQTMLSFAWDVVAMVATFAWGKIRDAIVGAMDSAKEGVRTALNGLVGFVESGINGIIDGINGLLDAAREIDNALPEAVSPWDVPGNLGHISIPRLATGLYNVGPSPMLAVLDPYERVLTREEAEASRNGSGIGGTQNVTVHVQNVYIEGDPIAGLTALGLGQLAGAT